MDHLHLSTLNFICTENFHGFLPVISLKLGNLKGLRPRTRGGRHDFSRGPEVFDWWIKDRKWESNCFRFFFYFRYLKNFAFVFFSHIHKYYIYLQHYSVNKKIQTKFYLTCLTCIFSANYETIFVPKGSVTISHKISYFMFEIVSWWVSSSVCQIF